jgi:hypothetical protein
MDGINRSRQPVTGCFPSPIFNEGIIACQLIMIRSESRLKQRYVGLRRTLQGKFYTKDMFGVSFRSRNPRARNIEQHTLLIYDFQLITEVSLNLILTCNKFRIL